MEYTEKTIEILLAAKELFSENGFKGVTTREIAKRAGVNEVTIFRQFTNKETLFDEVLAYVTSKPDIDKYLNLNEKRLEDFLIGIGNLIHKVFFENIDVLKIELLERNRLDKTGHMIRFPNQLKEVFINYLLTRCNMKKRKAETFAISFMTAIHGVCINKYLFHTFDVEIDFEQSLGLIINGFK